MIYIIVGVATTAAMRAYILKHGVKYTVRKITKKDGVKIVCYRYKRFSGLGTVIRLIIKNILDSGSTVVEWRDNRDYI